MPSDYEPYEEYFPGSFTYVTLPFNFVEWKDVVLTVDDVVFEEGVDFLWKPGYPFPFGNIQFTETQTTKTVRATRITPYEKPALDPSIGSFDTENELDVAQKQLIYAIQELRSKYQPEIISIKGHNAQFNQFSGIGVEVQSTHWADLRMLKADGVRKYMISMQARIDKDGDAMIIHSGPLGTIADPVIFTAWGVDVESVLADWICNCPAIIFTPNAGDRVTVGFVWGRDTGWDNISLGSTVEIGRAHV